MVLNCFGVMFLTPGSEALVDRGSSVPLEFLSGSRPESVRLVNKSCQQDKDTPASHRLRLQHCSHIPSPPFFSVSELFVPHLPLLEGVLAFIGVMNCTFD
ncbi:hypothetical protein XENORESO_013126 [Xenotaenia resolanae]|uniref:Uncharacterized protein n=1 Tax=Xenotaenia resolanae TaxID=208358 RepID=A0ABV0WQX7_9TELE